MSDATTRIPSEPDGAPRIATLDILRGIAILGILFMNINSMGASMMASGRWPSWIGAWTPVDRGVWYIRQVFADGTARCMLELLFGAGMVILTGRAAEAAGWWRVAGAYYWRNVVLFALGLAHVFLLLWPGDILHMYAVAALIAFLFRGLPARWLIPLGLSFAIWTAVSAAPRIQNVIIENARMVDVTFHQGRGESLSGAERAAMLDTQAWHRQIVGDRRAVAREDRSRTSDFVHWRTTQWATWWERIRPADWRWWIDYFGEAIATMLLGAGLFKLGILSGQRSRAFYARMWLLGWLLGGTLRFAIAATQDNAGDSVSLLWAFREWGRLAMTLGHVGAVNLLLTTMVGARWLQPFAAAGRTALSIYIAQTVICLWLLYPPFALGLYGTQGWAALMLTAAGVNLVLLVAASAWVRRFRIAPVEWLWRSTVALRPLPFRNRPHVTVPQPALA